MSKILSPFLTDRRESQEDPESHTGRLWVFYSLLYWNGVDLQCCVSLHCAMKLKDTCSLEEKLWPN